MYQVACKFPFDPAIVELARRRAPERLIEQWSENSTVAALNQNEAADAPSPAVIEAIRRASLSINRYPDHQARELRAELSDKLGVDAGCLIFGNGSYEIIAMVCQVILQPGMEMAVPTPTYSRYSESALLCGADYRPIPLRSDGCNDPDAMAAAARSAAVTVICTPNNPTGAALSRREFRQISDAVGPDRLLIVDEAYGDFSRMEGGLDAIEELHGRPHPWIVIRTLSKAYGLAGLRFGYAVASHPQIADMVDGVRGLFNVGRIAQAAARAAIGDEAWSRTIVRRTVNERERMRTALENDGWTVFPSMTNFLTIRVDGPGYDVRGELRKNGILTSLVAGPGYEDCVRISVGLPDDTDRVLRSLRDYRSRMPAGRDR